jgi:predicted aminopeptidase
LLPWLLMMAGCQSLGYYAHLTRGQLQLLGDRVPVERKLRELADAPDDASARLAGQLTRSQALLEFAASELALPVGRRYRSYVELGRPYVVWNVVAAPEFSLTPHRWCYPVAGCAPYRGYFNAAAAARAAERLAAGGMDVYTGGVAAYSTLGWFADPLLSSFIGWPEPELAELLFHELAHGAVWVTGDVAFNESYATFVGLYGAAHWRAVGAHPGSGDAAPGVQGAARTAAPDPDALARESSRAAWRRLLALLNLVRERLEAVYGSGSPPAVQRAAKAAVLDAARACHAQHREALGGGRYDALLAGLNNATLASIATYEDLVPAFASLFDGVGGDWPAFHDAVRELAARPAAERATRLARLRDEQVAAEGDDHAADQVQCEALARHVAYAESAGAEHDHVGRGGDREHEGA